MSDSSHFDLTTTQGRERAMRIAEIAMPQLALLRWVGEKVAGLLSTEREAQIAKELIAKGRENGAKEMKIRLNKKAGLSLGADVEGLPVKLGAEYDGTVEVHVVYK